MDPLVPLSPDDALDFQDPVELVSGTVPLIPPEVMGAGFHPNEHHQAVDGSLSFGVGEYWVVTLEGDGLEQSSCDDDHQDSVAPHFLSRPLLVEFPHLGDVKNASEAAHCPDPLLLDPLAKLVDRVSDGFLGQD